MRYARDLSPGLDNVANRYRAAFPEIRDELFWALYEKCKDYSLLEVTGFLNVYSAFRYLKATTLRGAAVECGCFLGGIAAFMGLLRQELGLPIEIVLFDSFDGPPVGSSDIVIGQGKIDTPSKLPNFEQIAKDNIGFVVGSLQGYRFVAGLVEDTLPRTEIDDICLLRLDTDFYSSTSIELETLYPKLAPGGVLIIDDYGLFQGAGRAADEYFAGIATPPLLLRIDTGIVSGIKPASDAPGHSSAKGRRWFFGG